MCGVCVTVNCRIKLWNDTISRISRIISKRAFFGVGDANCYALFLLPCLVAWDARFFLYIYPCVCSCSCFFKNPCRSFLTRYLTLAFNLHTANLANQYKHKLDNICTNVTLPPKVMEGTERMEKGGTDGKGKEGGKGCSYYLLLELGNDASYILYKEQRRIYLGIYLSNVKRPTNQPINQPTDQWID